MFSLGSGDTANDRDRWEGRYRASLLTTIPARAQRRQATGYEGLGTMMGAPWRNGRRSAAATAGRDCYTNVAMGRIRQLRALPATAVCLLALAAAIAAAAQETKSPAMSAGELVRLTVANEVAAAQHSEIKHMFRSRKKGARGTQTHLYVETTSAMAGMLVAINDHPLNAQQRQAETDHLAWLINNPDQLRRKEAREKEDADRSLRIVKALPYAFRYQYSGTQSSEPGLGKEGTELVRLNFSPNPAYSPPTHVEQVLTGMNGFLLIDEASRRIAVINGTLFKDVTFGWGIFGRLDQGGHFLVQQADVGDGAWEITKMHLDIKGKILLFKPISMVSDEVFSDFRRVPDTLTFAQGAEMLKSEREKLAHKTDGPESPETQKFPQ
jgi:hypothetical protein